MKTKHLIAGRKDEEDLILNKIIKGWINLDNLDLKKWEI
jgi:hypothetical protein